MSDMRDIDLLNFYKIEYFKEWHAAWKNGVKLTPDDIRMRLGIK